MEKENTKEFKNKSIAEMLGWKYVSSIEIRDNIYDQSIKAGWYSKLPKILHHKINGLFYKGRSHNDLKFHSDANWQFEAIDWIEKLKIDETGYAYVQIVKNNIWIYEYKNYTNYTVAFFNGMENPNSDRKEAIFETLFQFSQYIKNK